MRWKTESNQKALSSYRLVLVDIDGTLYEQRPVRVHMALRLLKTCFGQKGGFFELYTILQYRKLREHWQAEKENAGDELDELQYQALAEKLHREPKQVEEIINRWMLQEPLDCIKRYSDAKLLQEIRELTEKGVKVVLYSDYPTQDKKKALGLEALDGFCAADPEINSMKPDPKGILHIVEHYQVQKEDAVMIGDRMEKDGQAAVAAGIDYRIVHRSRKKR